MAKLPGVSDQIIFEKETNSVCQLRCQYTSHLNLFDLMHNKNLKFYATQVFNLFSINIFFVLPNSNTMSRAKLESKILLMLTYFFAFTLFFKEKSFYRYLKNISLEVIIKQFSSFLKKVWDSQTCEKF